jgi:NADPH-dependent curcumin reductase CurA
MAAPTQIQEWKLKNLPSTDPVYEMGKENSTWELTKRDVPELQDSQLLIQAVYLSNDPAQRGWIQKGQQPLPVSALNRYSARR